CHISVLPTPHSPSGCTCTDSLSEVNRNFTRIGSGGEAVYQSSPIFLPPGTSIPHTLSCAVRVSLTGLGQAMLRHDEVVNAIETALQFLHRSGVGNAYVPVGSERFSGHYGHMRIGQQPLGELRGAGDAVLAEGRSDVRIGVEGAHGLGAADTGNGAQTT